MEFADPNFEEPRNLTHQMSEGSCTKIDDPWKMPVARYKHVITSCLNV